METALSSETGHAVDRTGDRRVLLATTANPGVEHDLLVTLHQSVSPDRTVTVRYVPDRLVLDVAAGAPYWRHPDLSGIATPEALAALVLDDFNNEVVPRWIEIEVAGPSHGHRVAVSDRQPRWDNPALLDRLQKL